MPAFERTLEVDVPREELYQWHARPGAFARLQPPWESVRMLTPPAPIEDGAVQELAVGIGPVRQKWRSQIRDVVPGEHFRDVQLAGPFARWEHTHSMEETGPTSSRLRDSIEYELPFGGLGATLGSAFVKSKIERMFAYRHRITRADLVRHAELADRPRLDVVVSGASGLVGTALCAFLTTGGHRVRRLVRGEARGADEFRWDPSGGSVDPAAFEGADAIVHLAGENIAGGRWNAAHKARIRASRVDGTRTIVEEARRAVNPPPVLVSASAVGIYGDRGDERVDEGSSQGDDFLAEVCQAWEAEASRYEGGRTVMARFGVVLSAAGGALAKMLPPFLAGAGGRLGSGRQWMSWVALDDVVGALHHALFDDSLSGPVNVVAPHAATNLDFTRTLGRVLRRPTIAPMPAPAARLAFGELADHLLLAGQHVGCTRLQEAGYRFEYAELEPALRHQLGR